MSDRQRSEAIPATPDLTRGRTGSRICVCGHGIGRHKFGECLTDGCACKEYRYAGRRASVSSGFTQAQELAWIADDDARVAAIEAAMTAKDEELRSLREELAEAREACPIVRRQDYFDAPLVTLINKEVSQLFAEQSRAEKAEAELRSLREASAGAQWQPIETAPKGEGVIVWWPEYSKRPCSAIQQQDGQWRAGGGEPTSKPRLWWPLPSPPGAPVPTSPSEQEKADRASQENEK